MTVRTRWPASTAVIALVAVLLGVALLGSPAQAQDDVVDVDMALASIDAVFTGGADDRLDAVLEIDSGPDAREDLRLVTTVHTRVDDPSELDAALLGDTSGVYASVSTEVQDLAAGELRLESIRVTTEDLELDDPDLAGVYPLEFRLFQRGDAVGSVTTAAVVVPEDPPDPLPTSLVVRVAADDTVPLTGDVLTGDMAALLAPDGALVDLARDLDGTYADGSAAGLTLALDGRTLSDLATIADGYALPDGQLRDPGDRRARRARTILDRLAELLRRPDVSSLSLPYGPADIVALVRGGEADEAVRLLDTGRQAVRQLTGRAPLDDILVPPDGLDADTVAALGATTDAFLLEERYLALAGADMPQPLRRLRTADGGEVRMLVADESLSAVLGDPRDEGLAATTQRLTAATALRWLSADGADEAAVLLQVDGLGALPDGMLTAATDTIGALDWLRPMSLGTLADVVDPSDRVIRLAYPPSSRAAELDEEYVEALGAARSALVPIRALLPDSDTLATTFGRSLLAAAALPYRSLDERAAGLARIEDTIGALEGLAGAVSVVEAPPVTLTSTTGEIPISLVNEADQALDVRVRVGSTGFEFDEPITQLTLPPNATQTLTFRATALNPGGLSGVGVAVEDPTGRVLLVSSTIAVRSTAFPVVALVATIGAALFLAVWGLRQTRRRRVPGEATGDQHSDEQAADPIGGSGRHGVGG
ncbi:DUF6049 family protein [Euzebya rosea]|uniref:DUF6049 family protein n=1 Tax=Euzebya rosea TaxID=2052804 RepID=UPI000D3E6F62|nr:DUF6049 family protein [Euzebya rosea]